MPERRRQNSTLPLTTVLELLAYIFYRSFRSRAWRVRLGRRHRGAATCSEWMSKARAERPPLSKRRASRAYATHAEVLLSTCITLKRNPSSPVRGRSAALAVFPLQTDFRVVPADGRRFRSRRLAESGSRPR